MNPVLVEGYIWNFCHQFERQVFNWHYDNLKKGNFVEYDLDGHETLSPYMLHERLENFREYHNFNIEESKILFERMLKTIESWERIVNDIDGVKDAEFLGEIYNSTYSLLWNIERCTQYLKHEINEIEKLALGAGLNDKNGGENTDLITWENKTELAEFIQALFLSKVIKINGKEMQQNQLIQLFSKVFNSDLKTFNTLLSQGISNKSKSLFMDKLAQLIKEYRETKDAVKKGKGK